MSLFPTVRPSVTHISQELYIVWSYILVQMCKMMIFLGVLFHFLIFFFWEAIRGIKGQKIAQNELKIKIIYICLAPYLRNSIHSIWSWFLGNLSKMMISLGVSFQFFWSFIFRVVSGLRGKKWPKMRKNSVTLHI